MKRIKNFIKNTSLLLSSVPALTLALFFLSVFAMNLLANKSLDIPLEWLALDCGIAVSWASFLCMDVLTKHFGPKAATTLSILAAAVNLVMCLVFYLSSLIPGTWGAFFDFNEDPNINAALDSTFGGTWYVVLGSTVAFLASAAINNFANWGIGRVFHRAPDGFLAYACRTYVSTAIGQFADNLIFALIVSHVFFGWSMLQCVTCAVTGMVAELLVEAAFSPIGYKICKIWRDKGVGAPYFRALEEQNEGLDHGNE